MMLCFSENKAPNVLTKLAHRDGQAEAVDDQDAVNVMRNYSASDRIRTGQHVGRSFTLQSAEIIRYDERNGDIESGTSDAHISN